MRTRLLALAIGALLAGCAQRMPLASSTPAPVVAPVPGTLRVATWNLEFLAAHNDSGCHPRGDRDYAELRQIADSLDADVIAFEEVESLAAAARVFDPARYDLVIEQRAGEPGGACGQEHPDKMFIRQAVGFAVRKGIAFDRAADLTALAVGNPNLRSGVDITVRPAGGRPLRLLAIHLKSGCFQGEAGPPCPVLLQQVPVLKAWVDAAALGDTRFAVLGDWNRRLALPGDRVWAAIDDHSSANADLTLGDAGTTPHCDPRFHDFIDHIVLDKRAAADLSGFRETVFAPGRHPSDHCPVSVTLAN